MRCLILQPVDLILAFLQLKLQVVQLTEHTVQPLIVAVHMALGRLNDAGGNAQLLTDQERIGFARHAHAQLVGGP